MDEKHDSVFYICLAITILLLVGGFFAPPLGIIDNSVLVGCGFISLLALIKQIPTMIKGRSVELKHGETSLTLGDDDN